MWKTLRIVWIAMLLTGLVMNGIYSNAEATETSAIRVEKTTSSVGKGKAYIPRVTGITQPDLQEKINANLKAAILALAQEEQDASLNGDFEVSFDNGSLLGIHFIGYSMTPGAAHPNKIDAGIHMDLTTGAIYSLKDLFVFGIDFEGEIKALCEKNQEQYRLHLPGLYDTWPHSEFVQSWSGNSQSLLLQASSMRVYSIPRYATGVISGYRVPYADLSGIINHDSDLWKKLRAHVIDKMHIQVGEVLAGVKVASVDRRANSLVDVTFDGAIELVGESEWQDNTGDGPGYIFTIAEAYLNKMPVLDNSAAIRGLRLKTKLGSDQVLPRQKTKVRIIIDEYSTGERQIAKSATLIKILDLNLK